MIQKKWKTVVMSIVLTVSMILAMPLSVLAEPVEAGGQDQTAPQASAEEKMAVFSDVDVREWYYDGVFWVIEKGIMNGTGDHAFEPLTSASRAMIVTMLWRMQGNPEVDGAVTFRDVQDGQWYTDAVRWAVANDLVNGYDVDTFGTDDPVTREQLATILYRYGQRLKDQGFTGTWAFPLKFEDADQVSGYAYEPMCWMTMNGIIQGMNEKILHPQGEASRAQVATILMRFCEKLTMEGETDPPSELTPEDRAKIDAWIYRPDDAVYLSHKTVFDNPVYYNQETGEINWPANNGAVEGTNELIVLEEGSEIDRFGAETGFFLAAINTPYEQRSCAPGSDQKEYHQYRVVKPIEGVEKGITSPWFDEPGGGLQYMMPESVETLIQEGYLERIQ